MKGGNRLEIGGTYGIGCPGASNDGFSVKKLRELIEEERDGSGGVGTL